jgi:hypothetical protein
VLRYQELFALAMQKSQIQNILKTNEVEREQLPFLTAMALRLRALHSNRRAGIDIPR